MMKLVSSSSGEAGVRAHTGKGSASSETETGEARDSVWCGSCPSTHHPSRQNVDYVISDVSIESARHITQEVKYVWCFFVWKSSYSFKFQTTVFLFLEQTTLMKKVRQMGNMHRYFKRILLGN
jgi:hypothetical protein